MRSQLVDARDQQSHTIGAFAVVLRIGLGAVADHVDDALDGDGAAVGHLAGQGLLFHEVGEDAGVGGEAGEGHGEVVVDADDFLLVGGQFFGVSLELYVRPRGSERKGRIRDGDVVLGAFTFRAVRTTCFLLASPTTTEPCLTASWAYST